MDYRLNQTKKEMSRLKTSSCQIVSAITLIVTGYRFSS